MNWKYFIPGWGETATGADVIPEFRGDEDDGSWAAQAAAEYIHDNRDGWESEWPMDIGVISPKGEIRIYEIDREHVPSFFATGNPKIL